jgi:hypothetical protein
MLKTSPLNMSIRHTLMKEADQLAPQLTQFQLAANDASDPSNWQVRLGLSDAGSGLPTGTSGSGYGTSGSGYSSSQWIGNLEFQSPDGNDRIYVSINSDDRISGDAQQGTYEVSLPLDESDQPGTWTLSYLNLQDAAGNQLSVNRQGNWDAPITELQRSQMATRLGLDPLQLSFDYSNSLYGQAGKVDLTAPSLLNLSWIVGEQPPSTPTKAIRASRPGRTVHEVSNMAAFAVILDDGSVASWGDPNSGGDSSGVDFNGPNDDLKVVEIFSSYRAFAALRDDGSVVTWGFAPYGGDSSGVD